MPLEGIPRLADFDLAGKRVLIRADLNVPLADGGVADDTRIRAFLPTLQQVVDAGARVLVLSHLGRPEEGKPDSRFSLAPVAQRIADLVSFPIRFEAQWLDGVNVVPGEVVLCENVRFNPGEKSNDPELARQMAALCDLFVMDAFGTAHRAQASTAGVAHFAPAACAGPLLVSELEALGNALHNPRRPLVAVVGGAKVSSKLALLENLLGKVEGLVVGGGIANTFLAAQGHDIGASLYEPDLVETSSRLIAEAARRGVALPLPERVLCAAEFSAQARAVERGIREVRPDELILDVTPQFARSLDPLLSSAGTIVWNGPLGVFEFDAFAEGTRILAQSVAASSAFSVAGGGDTLAAIARFGVGDRISYISTGGGAFLEFMEGKALPGVEALRRA
ncbi:MAG: phosphoglycerate kinase [Pseudomonadota bacterium]|nr:phosphoglycerate kinase [Pseudomonadota bacterium]